CYADEFRSILSTKNRGPYTGVIKYMPEVASATWTDLQGWTLMRNSTFIFDGGARRQVPDTTIMDPLCPYLQSLGFAGWYGGTNIPVNVFGNTMVEEYYVCLQADAFDSQQAFAATAWSTLPATPPPGAPTDYYPRGIVKIPSSTGRIVSTTAVS